MTAPIDAGETALKAALVARLVAAELISSESQIGDKPINPLPAIAVPSGARLALALVRVGPRVRRVYIGGGGPVYALDLLFNIEFAAADPDKAKRETLEGAVQDIVAAVLRDDPTLGGAVQRIDLEDAPQLSDAPPAAIITAIPLALAVTAGDPLGRLAPAL
jgi:hypothetical protein